MAVNAVIHAGFLACLLVFARTLLVGARFTLAAILLTLLFVLAFDWENTLQGFQSQFYLLEWTAFTSLLLLAGSAPLSSRWFLGWLAAAAGLGTMSSGFLAPAAAIAVLVLRASFRRTVGWRDWVAGLLLVPLCVVGLATLVTVPGHAVLKAHTLGEWLSALAAALSWPDLALPGAFLVMQLPFSVLLFRSLSLRRVEDGEAGLLSLGIWSWVQAAVVAYGRANQGMIASPRYSDLFAVAAAVNLLALGRLWQPGPKGRAWGLFAALWGCAYLCGLGTLERRAYDFYLGDFARLKPLEKAHVRSFLASGDRALLNQTPVHELPYPMPGGLADLLSEPAIRSVLPASVRPPLALEPVPGSSGFHVEVDPATGARTWEARQGPARFVSSAFPASILPFVRIAIRGSPELTVSVLRIEPTEGGPAEPGPRLSQEQWTVREFPVPESASAHLVVEVPGGAHFVAFTEPVELGGLSWFTHWILRRSRTVEAAGAILFGMALTALLLFDLRGDKELREVK